MSRKEEYKKANEQYLADLRKDPQVKELSGGILYRILEEGKGGVTPQLNSVVTVHYRGTLINGKEFDNSWRRGHPEAFRLRDVIEGWQIALQHMHVEDKWTIYIPCEKGYGLRGSGPIPGGSALIFEVRLLSIM